MDSPWDAYQSGLTLRDYQRKALVRYAHTRKSQHSFYLVAPPGSGKTILGLEMAQRENASAVCFSPNAAIQMQWLARLKENWVCVDDALGDFQPHPICGDEVTDPDQVLLSLTYQRISVRDKEGNPHPNVLRLFEALKAANIKTVILDECHHLSAVWGRAVQSLCEYLDAPCVIGLTATPVIQEEGPLNDLLGEADHEISLPWVIRKGDLAPIQDLCHLVPPSKEEEAFLHEERNGFERLFAQIEKAEDPRPSLMAFCAMWEVTPPGLGSKPAKDLFDFYQKEPELVMAWSRYLTSQGQSHPALLPYAPEFYEPAVFADQVLLLAAYTSFYLLDKMPLSPLTAQAQALLKNWGYETEKEKYEKKAGQCAQVVGFSREKLQGMGDILRSEMRVMGDDLRVLVLTDYEFPPKNRAGLSCVDVMDFLTSTEDLDELDPILITGKSFLVDDDLWPLFVKEIDALKAKNGWQWTMSKTRERGYWRLDGEGKEWSTKTHVAAVTHLLEKGITRCLVGTRSLLGEGWDCKQLNTLIDLTVVTSGVSVNQIRGRTIRKDAHCPHKVANNWDVLCLSPWGEATEVERLHKKHLRLYGITDDGQVEKGMGHIHPAFEMSVSDNLYAHYQEVNEDMHRQAEDRQHCRALWRVGDKSLDEAHAVMCFRVPNHDPSKPASAEKAPRPTKEKEWIFVPGFRKEIQQRMEDRAKNQGMLLLGGLVASAMVVGVGLSWPLCFLASPLIPWGLYKQWPEEIPLDFQGEGYWDLLLSLAAVLALAYEDGDVQRAEMTSRQDGSFRLQWIGGKPEDSARLSMALAEMVGPICNQRYLLQETLVMVDMTEGIKAMKTPPKEFQRVFSVPRLFAKKADANRLLKAWQARRNESVSLHHVSSKVGKELLRENLHQKPILGDAALREIWV